MIYAAARIAGSLRTGEKAVVLHTVAQKREAASNRELTKTEEK